jgi:hypothetical protein
VPLVVTLELIVAVAETVAELDCEVDAVKLDEGV